MEMLISAVFGAEIDKPYGICHAFPLLCDYIALSSILFLDFLKNPTSKQSENNMCQKPAGVV